MNVLKIVPEFLLAKLTFADMWSLKVNWPSIITPRSFFICDVFLWLVDRYLSAWYRIQVGKDQEKAQSEKDSHSKNLGGKNQTNNRALIP